MIRRNTNKTEQHKYTVIKDYGTFEIRKYEPAVFSYTAMKAKSYSENSSQGFRKLANYIFGGNEKKQNIAMTSPVSMTMEDSVTMKFKLPEGIDLKDAPKPSDPNVKFEEEPEKKVAAISFGGWANDDKINTHIDKLKKLLEKEGIEHKNKFSYLGYNPPYDLINRRNEVIVELKD
ncbi:heme-binding protein [bacterium]|nr:heme-binding protein [bacterium]